MGDLSRRFIPIDQAESAYQADAQNLLAREVYEDLLTFIGEAQNRSKLASAQNLKLDQCRLHSAILLDGKRGTGKSSILVNLPTYLASSKADWIARVHILKPVDPTLLEDHNDLFLNVIVAAVLSDKHIQAAQEGSERHRKELALQLQRLGHSLEKMQSQDDTKGLDKLRAFMGNQQLVEEVHNFFELALKIIDKDLLVLTIDDVDTSLSKAFENLEIVRRYLTTPKVLPVISGDGRLYDELTWRDFHGRILQDSNYRRADAYEHAYDLATEYQRKVLPLQYRLRMPDVSSYLADPLVFLLDRGRSGQQLQLRAFSEWINVFLSGPVNGLENSKLVVPLGSIRALTQLVYRCRELISSLPERFYDYRESGDLAHFYQMPNIPRDVIEQFAASYAEIRTHHKREYLPAYRVFLNAFERIEGDSNSTLNLMPGIDESAWCSALQRHFYYDSYGGPAYLVLTAKKDWAERLGGMESVFETPLFQPRMHEAAEYNSFKNQADLETWHRVLNGKLPEDWIKRLPSKSILPYPVPEVGGSLGRIGWSARGSSPRQGLVLALMLHRNYYSSSLRGRMVGVGRIIELVISSLLREVEVDEIVGLLSRAPFYSTAAVAATKVRIEVSGEEDYLESFDGLFNLGDYEVEIEELSSQIKEWRKRHGLETFRLSPWLVYNVFNKTLNQAGFFNPSSKNSLGLIDVVEISQSAFNSLWAAFGSFEKGRLFGLPPLVATVNIGAPKFFESTQTYTQNILPFYPRANSTFGVKEGDFLSNESASAKAVACFGKVTKAVTYFLGDHPLRGLLAVVASEVLAEGKAELPSGQQVSDWISQQLGIESNRINIKNIEQGLREKFDTYDELEFFSEEFRERFPKVPAVYEMQVSSAIERLKKTKKYRS
ncbi:hypothetical protein HU764_020490 [Pseudomonas sp. SWRI100]|uniref:antiviral RADAR system adenosine triphosphatase RdrA n=1 Tax=Pseudomonas TaxID=286 RepID=UPI001644EC4B|nr:MULTISPECIES: antiviral RADAR system adenosine triphosphatase RdrA [Pseudomonas]MBC3495129.1 hypothetical protein [Pseudomonas sp. SWRI67]MBV4528442.1 hypothetical protein [Pseudomonas kermanshahensis]